MPIRRRPSAAALIAAQKKRAAARALSAVPVVLTSPGFLAQRQFIDDPCRFKAILATTRAAKSFTAGLDMMESAARMPDFNGLIIGLTLGSVRETFWIDILKAINLQHNLGAVFNESRLTVTLPSGGRFRLVGLDRDADEVLKLQGTKYSKIYADEAGSFRNDLRRMVNTVLRPRLADKRGTLVLIGTPTDLTQGLFYDVTKPGSLEPEWKTWHWKAWENPFVQAAWCADRDAKVAANPLVVGTPHFKQMYLGEWVLDESNLVYRFSPARNTIPALPPGEYQWVLGVDFGWTDATAFVVLAWNLLDRRLFVVSAQKESFLNFDEVALRIQHLKKAYDIGMVIGDGANRQGIETMNSRYGLGVVIAEKRDKYTFQQLLNSDLLTERIVFIDGPATQPLQKEAMELIWDERELRKIPPKHVEHPSLDNHCLDAFLYGWRHTHNYAAEEPVSHEAGSPEALAAARAERIAGALARQARRDTVAGFEEAPDLADLVEPGEDQWEHDIAHPDQWE